MTSTPSNKDNLSGTWENVTDTDQHTPSKEVKEILHHILWDVRHHNITPEQAKDKILKLLERTELEGRIKAYKDAYDLTIKEIQKRQDDPKIMWHTLFIPLLDRHATLTKELEALKQEGQE